MPDEIAIQALPAVTRPDAPARCTIVAADWTRLATAYRTRASLHIVDDLAPGDNDDNLDAATMPTDLRKAISQCEPTRRRALLVDHVAALVAAVMGLDSPQSLDPSTGFFQFGMDSLMSVTLHRALNDSLGLALPAVSGVRLPDRRCPHRLPRHHTSRTNRNYRPDKRRRLRQPHRSRTAATTFGKAERSAMTTAPSDRRAIITEALHKIDELSARLEIAEKGDTEPIAVVGMGCRFPGGVNNPDQVLALVAGGAQRHRAGAAGALGCRRAIL